MEKHRHKEQDRTSVEMKIKRKEIELLVHVLNAYRTQCELYFIKGSKNDPILLKKIEDRIDDTECLIDKFKEMLNE